MSTESFDRKFVVSDGIVGFANDLFSPAKPSCMSKEDVERSLEAGRTMAASLFRTRSDT